MYARGDSYGKIVAELNRRGWMTRRGNLYSKITLIGILRNEKYTGTYIYNRAISKSPDGKRNNWRSKPDDEIIRIPGGMPAIISQETWELVSQRIVANRNKGARNKARRNYLLSGKIFCGKCGSPFVGNTMRMRGHEYAYYECSAKKRRRDCQIRGIRADFIEEKVLERLYNELFAPKRIEKAADEIIQYMQSRNSDLPARIAELRQQMLKNKREINNIVDAIASGLNSDSLRVRLLFLERVKDDIQSRLDDAIQKSNEISYTHEQVISFLQSFQDIMSAPFEKQRRAVEIFIDRVYIYDDIFYIDILNPLSHKERSKKNQTGENGNFGFEQSRSVSTNIIEAWQAVFQPATLVFYA
jgi:site-specific DNA recombinase